MKTKVLTAYEPDDSVTIRLTPTTLGQLVAKIPNAKLDEFVESLVAESVFMTDERRDVLGNKLLQITKKLNGDFR